MQYHHIHQPQEKLWRMFQKCKSKKVQTYCTSMDLFNIGISGNKTADNLGKEGHPNYHKPYLHPILKQQKMILKRLWRNINNSKKYSKNKIWTNISTDWKQNKSKPRIVLVACFHPNTGHEWFIAHPYESTHIIHNHSKTFAVNLTQELIKKI